MSMWGRYANGRGLAARVRGAVAGGKAGSPGDRVPDQGGEAQGARRGGATGIGHAGAQAGKPSKYGNTRLTVSGETFDSQREMERYHHLRILQRAGKIQQLERQVAFILAPAVVIGGRKRPALKYVADFTYVEEGATVKTVEDVKGHLTEGYRIKRHLMAAMGIQIKEVR
ncbi:hypothetical protein Tamer19_17420 [Cupriavidus sp. TA19]|uniref:DUF1064 domain-containing protein n=1 Tax=Cupriavidus sp. TA19 TaxID=701108 RepID=UPI00272947A8|nr:DUF1064 domain-containing protein [Cupriavidus sp. TA19]GLC92334.1 hypothetical protein Tamer19_17420 [Cupriavidus sp. TA19]